MTTTPLPPNKEGATQCIVRWQVETDAGWLGAYNKDAFEAYATQARADLEAENQRLRNEIDDLRKAALEPPTNKTHRCIKCLHAYWVGEGKNEDCPACGHDGTALEKQHG